MVFFFNDTATTEIYTLSLHDALPIFYEDQYTIAGAKKRLTNELRGASKLKVVTPEIDRKSTRLNSSHANISYAVFCLKQKQSAGRCSSDCRNSHGRHPPTHISRAHLH